MSSGLNAVIDPRINPVAQAGNTTLWPKTKLPTDVAYVGTIGSGRSLPATGAQVGDYFLLTRSETGGPPSNRRVAGLYRRGTTAWEAVTLGGLNQAAVDARVVAGTLQPARSGDTTRWGKSKLPTDVAYTGNVGAGSSFPSSPQSGDYFLLTRGEASGPVQTRRASGLYRRGTSDWELVSFGITQTAGDARYVRLPAGAGPNFPSSPQSGDYFLLTRSETSGPVPSRRASGLYLRGATAWELVSFGITQTQGDARYQRLPYGAGPNFPSSPAINDFFLLTRAQTSGPVPQRKAAGLYKRGASDWELESTSGLTQAQVDARIIQQARIGDTSRWAKAKLPTDTAYTGTVGGGTSFPSSARRAGDYFLLTRGETTGPVPNRRAAGLYLRGASAWGLVSLGGLTQTQVDARIIQQARIGDTSRWAKAKLPADTVYGTVNGVGDRLPTTGMIFNDRFLLRRGYTTGRPPNTTNVFPGLYRRGNTAWALALGQGAPVSMWSKGDTLTLNRSELTPLVFDMGYTYGAVLTAGPIGSPGLGSGWRSRGTLTGGSATGSVSIAPTGGLYGIEDGLGAEIWVASTKVPSAVSINGVRRTLSSTSIANIYTSSGSGYPRFESGTAVNVQVEYSDGSFAWPNTQSDGRGSGSGITQTAADARYAPITVAGNALPTTGFNTGDYFLLRRTVSGPGGQGTLNAGLYRRTASAWELQSLGGGSAMGVGTAFPTTGRQTGDVFLLTRPVTGATTQVPRTATITLGRRSQFIGFIYGWSRSSPTFGSISPLPTWSGIQDIYWTGSRYEVGLSSAAADGPAFVSRAGGRHAHGWGYDVPDHAVVDWHVLPDGDGDFLDVDRFGADAHGEHDVALRRGDRRRYHGHQPVRHDVLDDHDRCGPVPLGRLRLECGQRRQHLAHLWPDADAGGRAVCAASGDGLRPEHDLGAAVVRQQPRPVVGEGGQHVAHPEDEAADGREVPEQLRHRHDAERRRVDADAAGAVVPDGEPADEREHDGVDAGAGG